MVSDLGHSIAMLDRAVDRRAEDDERMLTMTLSTPYNGRADYLIVARFECGTERMVAFHSAPTAWECLKGFCDRLHNNSLVLREDEYANR